MTKLREEIENEGKINERTIVVYQCQNDDCEDYSRIHKSPK
jgi:hypothetical protein